MVWTRNLPLFWPLGSCLLTRIRQRIESWEGVYTSMRLTCCSCRILTGTNLRPLSWNDGSVTVGTFLWWHLLTWVHLFLEMLPEPRFLQSGMSPARYDVCEDTVKLWRAYVPMGVNKVGTSEKHGEGTCWDAARARPRGRKRALRDPQTSLQCSAFSFVQSGSSDGGLESQVTDSDADMIARVENLRALTTD